MSPLATGVSEPIWEDFLAEVGFSLDLEAPVEYQPQTHQYICLGHCPHPTSQAPTQGQTPASAQYCCGWKDGLCRPVVGSEPHSPVSAWLQACVLTALALSVLLHRRVAVDLACEGMTQCPAYSTHSETLSTLPIISYFVPVPQPGYPEHSPPMPHVCICRDSVSHI